MAHEHSVLDNDKHFRIDPVTRQIVNTTEKIVLIQHDHDSERFTFEIPKTVEGHDMSKCNVVQIHYLNIEAATKTDNEGIYEVNDLRVSNNITFDGENEVSEEVVVCSWLISRNATQYAGSLNFVVRYKCIENDGTVSYEWATDIYKGIAVSESINNSEVIVSEYADVLEKWRASLFFSTDGVTGNVSMGGHKLTNVGSPTDDADATNKAYVDNALKNIDLSGVDASDKVSKAGDVMAGQLDMNTNRIIGVGDPQESKDAANKDYVDNKVGNIDVTTQLNLLASQLRAEMATKLGFVPVWENASPTSDFMEQIITFNSNHTVLAIVTNNGTYFVATYQDHAQAMGIHHAYTDSYGTHFVFITRPTYVLSAQNGTVQMEFENAHHAYHGSNDIFTSNSYFIPRVIYGVY